MQIEKNSRQMPKAIEITSQKNYCDLLYAWIQCNSERVENDAYHPDATRRISKKKISWVGIERDFTRMIDGQPVKQMTKRTIAKYFQALIDQGLIKEKDDGYYYLTVLDAGKAMLIEYQTLAKLVNVLQHHVISIYVYLFNRYFAAGASYPITFLQIKNFIGISTTTSSNNAIIADSLEILKRLGLMDYTVKFIDYKSQYEILWVRNKLPELGS